MVTMMDTNQGYDGDNEVELAATKIQTLHRKKSAKKRVTAKREGRAATKIQNRRRSQVAKKRVQKKRETRAAVKIQSVQRKKSAKRVVTEKRETRAAVKIQSVQRKKSAEKVVAEKRKEKEGAALDLEDTYGNDDFDEESMAEAAESVIPAAKNKEDTNANEIADAGPKIATLEDSPGKVVQVMTFGDRDEASTADAAAPPPAAAIAAVENADVATKVEDEYKVEEGKYAEEKVGNDGRAENKDAQAEAQPTITKIDTPGKIVEVMTFGDDEDDAYGESEFEPESPVKQQASVEEGEESGYADEFESDSPVKQSKDAE